MGRHPRQQRPVSCYFCRVRKLRCSRQTPCSNCVARDIPCSQNEPSLSARQSESISPTSVQSRDAPASDNSPLHQILSRLSKLEEVVTSQAKELESAKKQSVARPNLRDPLRLPAKLQRLTADALELEKTSWTGHILKDALVSEPIIFQRSPMALITNPSSLCSPSLPQGGPIRCIWLPQQDEALMIIEAHLQTATHLQTFIHYGFLRKEIEKLYSNLDSQASVHLGAAALLLIVCANALQNASDGDLASSIILSAKEANSRAMSWTKAAMDVLDLAERDAQVSLELIQAMVGVTFVFCEYEGASRRARTLLQRAISSARELGLHQMDRPEAAECATSDNCSNARKELGRRMWWTLVGFDWMIGNPYMSDGVGSTIDPKRMAVRKPRNIRDEDLIDGEMIVQPLNQATQIAPILQRIMLGEIVRESAEAGLSGLQNDEIDNTWVMNVDERLRKWADEIPTFLKLDHPDNRDLPPGDFRNSPLIIAQRASLDLLYQRLLCEYHLRFFARGAIDSAYAASKEICVTAARNIMNTCRRMSAKDYDCVTEGQKGTMVSRGVFMAVIALVLNACLSDDPHMTVQEDEDLIDGLRHLHVGRFRSVMGGKLCERSLQLLQKHNVKVAELAFLCSRKSKLAQSSTQVGLLPPTPDSSLTCDQYKTGVEQQEMQDVNMSFVDGPWPWLQDGPDLNTFDWERLLLGLDAPIM